MCYAVVVDVAEAEAVAVAGSTLGSSPKQRHARALDSSSERWTPPFSLDRPPIAKRSSAALRYQAQLRRQFAAYAWRARAREYPAAEAPTVAAADRSTKRVLRVNTAIAATTSV